MDPISLWGSRSLHPGPCFFRGNRFPTLPPPKERRRRSALARLHFSMGGLGRSGKRPLPQKAASSQLLCTRTVCQKKRWRSATCRSSLPEQGQGTYGLHSSCFLVKPISYSGSNNQDGRSYNGDCRQGSMTCLSQGAFTFLASRYPEDDDKAQFTAFHCPW